MDSTAAESRPSLPGLAGFHLVEGNAVRLHATGRAAFRDMRRAIEEAKESVFLETYIYRPDRVGREFAERLLAKAAEGLDVRVIYDSAGSLETPTEFFDSLERGGVRILEFRPIAPWRPRWNWRLNRRDHRKILVVDGRVGFVGGLNIGDEYDGDHDSSSHWRDYHLRVEGPAVARLSDIFRSQWSHGAAGRGPAAKPADPAAPAGDVAARFFATGPVPGQRIARTVFLRAIRHARRSIHMSYAYFLPERTILRALRAAARRGIDVRILLPRRTDVQVARLAGHSVYSRLLRQGVRIYELLSQPLHAKSVVVDSDWLIVGSANLDARSFLLNYEVGVEIPDRRLAEEMEEQFAGDLRRSEEIVYARWRRRPFGKKLIEKLCRFFAPLL